MINNCSPRSRLLTTAPNCAPMVEPKARVRASTTSTVWLMNACSIVMPLDMNRIWNRLVPTATCAGMPST